MNNFTHEMCWRHSTGEIDPPEYYYHDGKKEVYALTAPYRREASGFNVPPVPVERSGWILVPLNLIEAKE